MIFKSRINDQFSIYQTSAFIRVVHVVNGLNFYLLAHLFEPIRLYLV